MWISIAISTFSCHQNFSIQTTAAKFNLRYLGFMASLLYSDPLAFDYSYEMCITGREQKPKLSKLRSVQLKSITGKNTLLHAFNRHMRVQRRHIYSCFVYEQLIQLNASQFCASNHNKKLQFLIWLVSLCRTIKWAILCPAYLRPIYQLCICMLLPYSLAFN